MFHLRGPADPLAAGFPAFTQLHRQNQGGQQLGRGTEVGSIERHADISIWLQERLPGLLLQCKCCSKGKQNLPHQDKLVWHIFEPPVILSGSELMSESTIITLDYRYLSCGGHTG